MMHSRSKPTITCPVCVPDAERILTTTRAHWSAENTFPRTMDMVSGEDASRVRLDEAPENFAVIRHIVIKRLKRHPGKQNLKRERFRAALGHAFVMALLTPNLMR